MLFFPVRRERRRSLRRPVIRREGVEQLEQRLALAAASSMFFDIVDNSHLGTAATVYVTGHGIQGATPANADPPKYDLRVLGADGRFTQGAVKITQAEPSPTTSGHLRITTPIAHEVKVGQSVVIAGVNVDSYNGLFKVKAVDTGSEPKWFEFDSPPSAPSSQGSGGAVYLQTMISSQQITNAESTQDGFITVTLSGDANLPLSTPIVVSGLTGHGEQWVGTWDVSANSSSKSSLKSNQFQFKNLSGASGVATLNNANVHIVSVNPVATSNLPTNPTSKNKTIIFDSNIETYSSQIVTMVTPAATPYPLAVVKGTIDLVNVKTPPYPLGSQVGNSVFDIIEFYYAGPDAEQYSTFDLSQVDGFALPLTLAASSVKDGPDTVGVNPALKNVSREAIGQAFHNFLKAEPKAVQDAAFGRLSYASAVNAKQFQIAKTAPVPLTGVSLNPTTPNSANIKATTTGPHGLVPNQSITISGIPYKVATTGLVDINLKSNEFTFNANGPLTQTNATVTPIGVGVVATSDADAVVHIAGSVVPSVQDTVMFSGDAFATFPGNWTVSNVPQNAGLPPTAVFLASKDGQKVKPGDTADSGAMIEPVFSAPPPVPSNQFYVIAAPKDWLANLPVSAANVDPMVGFWDDSINSFFSAEKKLNIAIGVYAKTDLPNGSANQSRITGVTIDKDKGTTTFTIDTTDAGPNPYKKGDAVILAGFNDPLDKWYQGRIAAVTAVDTAVDTHSHWFTIDGTSGMTRQPQLISGTIAQLTTPISYTGVYNTTTSGFDFTPDQSDYPDDKNGFRNKFTIAKPTPHNVFPGSAFKEQNQSLANATWVWSQPGIPNDASGTVWDQILMAFARGVAVDGLISTGTPTPGQSNAAWGDTTKWYASGRYDPFSKFLHFGTLDPDGKTDPTGVESIYIKGLAYGFGLDESPVLANGTHASNPLGGPPKMDGTIPGTATVTLTLNPWVGTSAGAPVVSSIDTVPQPRPGSQTTPTTASSVSWSVTFNEPVQGVTAADFTLVASGLTDTSITSVTGSGGTSSQTWTVIASTGSGTGTLGLNLTSGTRIVDKDKVPLSLPNGKFVGEVYSVRPQTLQNSASPALFASSIAPALLSIDRTSASPTDQPSVSWTVSFTQPVADLSKENFVLVATDLTGARITQVVQNAGTGTSWTVTALAGSGNGTLGLEMVNATGLPEPPTGIPLVGQFYEVERSDATIVAAPMSFWTKAGVASKLIWKMPAFTDADSVEVTATLAVTPAAYGTLRAASRGGVTVTPSGTPRAELQFSGTVAALNAYFRNPSGLITYTPTRGQPPIGRRLTLSAQGSDGLSGMTRAELLVRAATQPTPRPAITQPNPVLDGLKGRPVVISYDQLVAATGATQTDSRSIQFYLSGVAQGRLEVWTGGRWAAVPKQVNTQLLAPGGQIRWVPAADLGGIRRAFYVRTYDGWRFSAVTSAIRVNLQTLSAM